MSAALCVRIKRRDGLILRATTHDRDIDVTASGYAGLYRAAAALSPSAIQARASLQVDGLDVSGALSIRSGIRRFDILAGVYDMARITVFETDWTDTSEVRELAYGVLGNKTVTQEGGLSMEVRSLSQLLAEQQGDLYSTRCRATLGSDSSAPILRRCGVDLSGFTFEEDVSAVIASRTVFEVIALTQDPGYFRNGLVQFLSGDNEGAIREIRRHEANGVLTVYDPLPFNVAAGDEVRVTAGCDKTLATCRDKFDNVVNFRGEPFIPGPGYMVRLADTEQ